MSAYGSKSSSGSFSPGMNPGYNPQYSQGWQGSGKNSVAYTPGDQPQQPNYGVRSRQNWGLNPNPPQQFTPSQLGNLPYTGQTPQQQPVSGLGFAQQPVAQQGPQFGSTGKSGLGYAGPIQTLANQAPTNPGVLDNTTQA